MAEHARRAREFVAFLLEDKSARPGGQFLLEVRRWADGATIALTDQGSHKKPSIPDLDDLSECGRGLQTVRAVATEWAWMGNRTGRTFIATFKGEAS